MSKYECEKNCPIIEDCIASNGRQCAVGSTACETLLEDRITIAKLAENHCNDNQGVVALTNRLDEVRKRKEARYVNNSTNF